MATQVISRSAIVAIPVGDKANVAGKVKGLISVIASMADSFARMVGPDYSGAGKRVSTTGRAVIESTLTGFRNY